MKQFFLSFSCLLILSCGKKQPANIGDSPWQIQKNSSFKDATTSPLTAKDLKYFKGLNFFKVNQNYTVKAHLKRTPNSPWFFMPTTTKTVNKERIFGELTFKIKNRSYTLNVYQGEEHMNTEGFENYLFLPFLDNTNGETTYGGGRYIDLRIPENDTLIIDFNKAYNPYCVYNKKFSCPIVPSENYLNTEITAGEKLFVPYK